MEIPTSAVSAANRPHARSELMQTARGLETAFLAEMLKAAGTVRSSQDTEGGSAEDPFTSFMADAQARALVAAGGLGLTPVIAASLARQQSGRQP